MNWSEEIFTNCGKKVDNNLGRGLSEGIPLIILAFEIKNYMNI